jgi:glycine/D-amino acid oxidase-like deaminating enzyme/nitrite reductase/ring-hydroxylating ferredoxin subunit
MATMSIWRATTGETSCRALEGDLEADVVVVGGGITGVTAALRLTDAGRSVVLLEAHEIGGGDTGHSTGNLYETVSGGMRGIRDKWGVDIARSVAQARREAVALIEENVQRMDIDCGFRRCTMYLYAGSAEAREKVDSEHEALQEIGLQVRRETSLPDGPPRAVGNVVVLDHQAQFHPLAYVRRLAAQAAASGCRVFERSAVIEVDPSARVVRTAAGRVKARELVLATHSPSGFHLVQAGMLPNREYGIAAPLGDAPFPPGIFWAQGSERLSVRSVDSEKGRFLVCVGQEHKTGQHDTAAAMDALERAARKQLAMGDIAFRWSAQNFRSPDGLPYIGRDRAGSFIATGFATDGLVYGSLAGTVIADQVLGRDNRWNEVFKATRIEPLKASKGTAEETASVVKVALQDYLTRRQHEQLERLAPGTGALVSLDGDEVAAYRDPSGTVYAVSPICTHMKCKVHWNAVETTWDCPCHGSRFSPDGRVVCGPAIEPLARKASPAE